MDDLQSLDPTRDLELKHTARPAELNNFNLLLYLAVVAFVVILPTVEPLKALQRV